MSTAVIGLIGVAIGALADVAGAVISQVLQSRNTRKTAPRSKKEEAYSGTLRNLLRVRNRSSGVSVEAGVTYIEQGSVKELFDDMVEVQFWATALTIYCSDNQKETVEEVSSELNDTGARFVSGEALRDLGAVKRRTQFTTKFDTWYSKILECARKDIGGSCGE